LRCLCGSEVVQALFHEAFINRIRVKRLIQSEARFAEATVCRLALVFILRKDRANTLALIRCKTELLDRVCGPEWFTRVLCRHLTDAREE